jgi:hypothetical protein
MMVAMMVERTVASLVFPLADLMVAKTAEKKVDLMAEQTVAPSVVW